LRVEKSRRLELELQLELNLAAALSTKSSCMHILGMHGARVFLILEVVIRWSFALYNNC
jgi:hypothetical protein